MTNQPKTIKLGLAGLGFGQAVHLPVWRSMAGIEIVGLADLDLKKAQAAGLRYGIENIYNDYETLLENNLDAVSLALPPKENELACQLALDKGISVFCEKPLAASLSAAELLANKAQGKVAMIDFEFFEALAFQQLKTVITQQKIGLIRHLNIAWLTNSAAQRQRAWGWKTDAQQGGGVVALMGSHLFFILEQIFGRVVKLTANLDHHATLAFTPFGQQAAEDLAHIILDLEGGVKAAVVLSNASAGSSVQRWEIIGESGTLRLENDTLDPLEGFILKIGRGEAQWATLYQNTAQGEDGRQGAFKILAERFYQSVLENKPAKPDFCDGLRVQEIMSAVYSSHKEQGPINL